MWIYQSSLCHLPADASGKAARSRIPDGRLMSDYGQDSDEAAERIRALEAKLLANGLPKNVPFMHNGCLRFNADVPAEDIEPPEGSVICQ